MLEPQPEELTLQNWPAGQKLSGSGALGLQEQPG